jgi:hypothetical protein
MSARVVLRAHAARTVGLVGLVLALGGAASCGGDGGGTTDDDGAGLEGSTAAGAFAFPLTASPPALEVTTFETDGSAVAGSFAFGLGKSGSASGADARVFTEGAVDVTLDR